ncbi:hypothetical protein COLO4_33857 [Corchorus olitorius]|uniref:Uncharacterized protein n=1 Tax=Corchorus olitorius TaxID=93759 RepID=A0A1R3GQL1_9ROSI|nr:hypothetical protein COLO4_33857 [Corchorus olitorius]
MKQSSPNSYFGVEINLDEINEDVFASDSRRFEVSNTASKRVRPQRGDERGSNPKKGKAGKEDDKAKFSGLEEVKELVQGVRAEMREVSTYFEHLNTARQSRTTLYQMVTNIEGLTKEEAIHIYGIISADKGNSESFMMILDDEGKFIYVKGVISGRKSQQQDSSYILVLYYCQTPIRPSQVERMLILLLPRTGSVLLMELVSGHLKYTEMQINVILDCGMSGLTYRELFEIISKLKDENGKHLGTDSQIL